MFVKRFGPFFSADPVPGGQPPAAQPPQAGDPPAQPAPATPQAGNEPELTPAEYKKMVADLRKENASHRTKLTAFEKAQAEAEAAKLSELEKATKRAAEAEAKAAQHERDIQELRVTVAIERQAAKLTLVDAEAAAKLLDWSEIQYDEHGQPTNIDKLLAQLAKDKPYLVTQPQQQAPQNQPPARQQPSMNPPRTRVAPQQQGQPFDYKSRPGLSSIWNKPGK